MNVATNGPRSTGECATAVRCAPTASVVVPVKNESGNIAPLVAELAVTLQGTDFEVIYVDDGSRDATDAELQAEMKRFPWLRLIRHDDSYGQAAAIRTGVLVARAPLVVTLDGDCQNDPAAIPPMIAMLRARAPRLGLVAAQRVGRKATIFKKLQSRVANLVRAGVLKDGTWDTGCGLKAFRRDVYLSLPHFDAVHCFLPALVRREGFEVDYLDVVDRPRVRGVSNYGLWNRVWVGILDMVGVWWLTRRTTRVRPPTEVTIVR